MKTDTQTKLIEIAIPLFALKGFAGVSVREITDAAQINVSAISYHFNGKEGLYQAVLEEQLTPLMQALYLAENDDSLSPIKRLTFYADQISQIHAQRPFLSRFMISEATTPTDYGGPIIEKYLSQVHQFMRNSLQEGITWGDFRPDLNITYAAVSLAGILNFYFITKPLLQKLTPLTENSNKEYTAHAFRIYLHGIVNNS
ncbi:TetR/AcrR family transcriptional regulator [Pelosinus sp. sgz500959]|uniref:TetR/AcrR family transcriptional regulator n=1 Tax=Pelosinus sp. sgz500959 TaxID=3242472 RepID=UPI003671F4D0